MQSITQDIWKLADGDDRNVGWSVLRCEDRNGMDALRAMFPTGGDAPNADTFVLFSTSGIHGSYATIEDVQEDFRRTGKPHRLTFLIVKPRILVLQYGNCLPSSPGDFVFLDTLRSRGRSVVMSIGF